MAADVDASNADAHTSVSEPRVIGRAWTVEAEEGDAAAARLLGDWLEGHPDAVQARLIRARMLSWIGRFAESRREIDRAWELSPEAAVQVTSAGVELSLGREGAAAKALDLAGSLDPDAEGLADVRERLRDATRPGAIGAFSVASETSGIDRFASSVEVFSWAADATVLDATLDVSSFHGDGESFVRAGLTAGVAQELPADLSIDLALGMQWVPDRSFVPRWSAELAWTPPVPFRTSVGFRRRSMVDDPVTHGTALPPLIGTAGAHLDDIARGIDQDEAFLRASGGYAGFAAWGEASAGAVDGNARVSVSAGGGYDVLAQADVSHALIVRYELYFLAFEDEVPDYYSPPGASSHTPGLEWHWRPPSGHQLVVLAAPILLPGGPTGQMFGASGSLHVAKRVDIGLGARHQGNKYYRISGASAWVSARW